MELIQMLSQASLMALLSLVVAVLPVGFGLAYALWPSEPRLALMRPISLAGIFAGLSGTLVGVLNTLSMFWRGDGGVATQLLAVGAAESLVPMCVAFGSLTFAWLCVAAGLARHP